MHHTIAAALAISLTAAAGNAATEFTIDPTKSTVFATIESSGFSDSDTSPLSGTVNITLPEPFGTEPNIFLNDYNIVVDEDLDFNLVVFAGALDATVSNASFFYPDGKSPFGPVMIDSAGLASVQNVPVAGDGTATYDASGLICVALQNQGFPCADTVATGAEPGATLPFLDILLLPEDPIVLEITATFDQPIDPDNPSLGNINFEVNITANAPLPVPCPGDTDASGSVGLDDLLTVLSGFGDATAAGPAAGDLDNSGATDLNDLLAVLSNFGDACP